MRTSGLGLLVRNPEVSGWGNVPHSGLVCDVRQMEKSGESWIRWGGRALYVLLPTPPPPRPQPCTPRME